MNWKWCLLLFYLYISSRGRYNFFFNKLMSEKNIFEIQLIGYRSLIICSLSLLLRSISRFTRPLAIAPLRSKDFSIHGEILKKSRFSEPKRNTRSFILCLFQSNMDILLTNEKSRMYRFTHTPVYWNFPSQNHHSSE